MDPMLTPDGAATLWDRSNVIDVGMFTGYNVVTGVRVHVAGGGRAGSVRVRAIERDEQGNARVLVGPWSRIPARAGDVVIPAPPARDDSHNVRVGLDQRNGGMAIVRDEPCESSRGDLDPCELYALEVHRPMLASDEVPGHHTPSDVLRGRQLDLEPVLLSDDDRDGVPDERDRANLRLAVHTIQRRAGTLTLAVAVTNAGPRVANDSRLTMQPAFGVGLGRWSECIVDHEPVLVGRPVSADYLLADPRDVQCELGQLGVGETRLVRVALPDVGPQQLRFESSAEGRVLRPRDAVADLHVAGRPTAAVVSAPVIVPWAFHWRRKLRIRVVTPYTGTVRVRLGDLAQRRIVFVRPGTKTLEFHVSPGQRRAMMRRRNITISATQRGRTTRTRLAG